MKNITRFRIITGLFISLITLAGFGAKYYSGPLSLWMNNSVAGLFYEIFWCLVIVFIWPSLKPAKIALWVFLITSMLEVLQLWHPDFLQKIRGTFLGAALLGNSFNPSDFIYYAIGCLASVILMKYINEKTLRDITK